MPNSLSLSLSLSLLISFCVVNSGTEFGIPDMIPAFPSNFSTTTGSMSSHQDQNSIITTDGIMSDFGE